LCHQTRAPVVDPRLRFAKDGQRRGLGTAANQRLQAPQGDPKASDREVARTLGVSQPTVGKVRDGQNDKNFQNDHLPLERVVASVRSDQNAEIPQNDHLPLERAKWSK
jgi:hypothetical protein